MSPEVLPLLMKRISYATLDDMYAAIGYGGFTAQKAVSRVQGELNRVNKQHQAEKAAQELLEEKQEEKKQELIKSTKSAQGIIVEGLDNCLVKFSKCCSPVPGDEIIGFITRGYGVSVHRADCPNASEERRSAPDQAGRWIAVSWGDKINDKYQTSIDIVCKDRSNLLLDVSAALSTSNAFVNGVHCHSTEDDFAIMHIDLQVRDGKHLQTIMNKLHQVSGVLKVTRPAG
jgi:GTP pyrophosphokinase